MGKQKKKQAAQKQYERLLNMESQSTKQKSPCTPRQIYEYKEKYSAPPWEPQPNESNKLVIWASWIYNKKAVWSWLYLVWQVGPDEFYAADLKCDNLVIHVNKDLGYVQKESNEMIYPCKLLKTIQGSKIEHVCYISKNVLKHLDYISSPVIHIKKDRKLRHKNLVNTNAEFLKRFVNYNKMVPTWAVVDGKY